MPACCGAPVDHPASVNAPAAVVALWLAVTFHDGSAARTRGSVASISATVHGALCDALAARTRATSAAVTKPAVFPKLLRMNEATPAIHSSLLVPIGTMTSVY